MSQLPIYTIGYGAREIDAFLDVLKQYQIDYIVDVRSQPFSRYKPEFSRRPLEQELTNNKIRYVFMGDSLGGQPDDPSCYDEAGKVDYEKCRRRPQFLAGIERLYNAHEQQLRVAPRRPHPAAQGRDRGSRVERRSQHREEPGLGRRTRA